MISASVFSQAGSFLTIPTNAQGLAMGQTYIGQERSGSVYTNLAASGITKKQIELDANYRSWLNGLSSGYNFINVNGFFSAGSKGAFAIGFENYTTPSYSVVDDNGEISGNYNPKELSFAIGYSYRFAESMAASLTVKYLESDLAKDYKASSVAFDLGFSGVYQNLTYGAVVKNVGPALKFDQGESDLPLTLGAGFGYQYQLNEKQLVSGAFDIAYLSIGDNNGVSTAMGFEYQYHKTISIRAGYRFTNDSVELGGLSLGAGVKVKNTQLNFAWLKADNVLDNNYNISLVFSLYKEANK